MTRNTTDAVISYSGDIRITTADLANLTPDEIRNLMSAIATVAALSKTARQRATGDTPAPTDADHLARDLSTRYQAQGLDPEAADYLAADVAALVDATPAPAEPAGEATRVAEHTTCDGCHDDIWPGETVYTLPAGEVLCGVCQIRRPAEPAGEEPAGGTR